MTKRPSMSSYSHEHSFSFVMHLMKSPSLCSICTRLVIVVAAIGLLAPGAKSAELSAEDPGSEGDGDYQIGPDYKLDPDLTDRGNPKGKSFEFTMPLAESKIFR